MDIKKQGQFDSTNLKKTVCPTFKTNKVNSFATKMF